MPIGNRHTELICGEERGGRLAAPGRGGQCGSRSDQTRIVPSADAVAAMESCTSMERPVT